MKKQTWLTILILIVLVAGGIALLMMKPATSKAPTAAPSALTGTSYSEHTTYYDIATNYASSTPLSGQANVAAVTRMKQFIQNTIDQFKTDGHFNHLTAPDIAAMNGRKEKLQITYLISSSTHTVSYIYTIYEDTLGAHGNTVFRTFTFNTATGAYVPLSDLFTSGSDYLSKLSTLARTGLAANLQDPSLTSFIDQGTTPDAKNFQDFFIDNHNLVLLFPPYQVAPYAAGPQTVRIPTTQLKNILNPAYQ